MKKKKKSQNSNRAYSFKKSFRLLKVAERNEAWATYRFKNFSQIEGKYPYYATRAKGAYVWDVDGNQYIDYLLGYGSVILGHADKRVDRVVIDEIKRGNNVSPLWKPIQIQLTNLLTSVIPKSEMAYLMRSGSDATSGAVRLARLFTKRDKVIRWGYHGWHDWATTVPGGIPRHIKKDILEFTYNDLESLKAIFEKYPKKVACVIMMPFELEKPKDGFLKKVRRICRRYGALFILDEMRSGFRLSLGGAQEYFDVQADLATFSKAIANGYPISAIVGRADVLAGLKDTVLGATYFGNTPEMAAAIATIKILQTTNALSHIWELGEYLRKETVDLISKFDIPAEFLGYPPFPFVKFTVDDGVLREKLKRTFYCEATRHGVFIHPNHHWYISASHLRKDIERTIEIFRSAFESVAKVMKK